jgi:hypothetical protein
VPKADNKLELFLWRMHKCNQMRALARVNTLWKLIITDAMRWLSGKANELKDWSLVSADRVLELAEAAFVAIAADGRKLLDPTLDPFAEIAASQPAFATWRAKRAQKKVVAPDGTEHPMYADVLAEARNPTGKGNVQSTPTTIALAERMANCALKAMYDTKRAIAEKLTSQDGACAPAKRQKMHEATIGAHVNNSRCESNFGSYDYVGHIFRGASASILGGLSQQMRNGDFERAPIAPHDWRQRKRKADGQPAAPPAADGFYHRLPSERLKQSLITYARHEAVRARKAERNDLKAHDEAKLARREERVIELLNKVVQDYAYAKELFAAWAGVKDKEGKLVKQSAADMAEVDRFLKDKPEAQQLEYLRKQIEMRVIGLGWAQFATRWSSNKDSKVGTVAHLKDLLKEIITEEITARRLKELPTEAALPQQIKRNLGQLGMEDEDAKEVEKKALFSAEELNAKAEAEMRRRVEAGISDTVESLNGATGATGAPAFNQQLVGKQMEVSATWAWVWASRRVWACRSRTPALLLRSLCRCAARMPGPNSALTSTSAALRARRSAGSTTTRTRRSQCSSGQRGVLFAWQTALPTGAARRHAPCCLLAWCCGRGTQTMTSARQRASSGWRCCLRSGTRPARCSTDGASTRASSQPLRSMV